VSGGVHYLVCGEGKSIITEVGVQHFLQKLTAVNKQITRFTIKQPYQQNQYFINQYQLYTSFKKFMK